MTKALENLNKEQLNIVKTTKGPLRIVAGPGSGKTRTITHRIAYLIDKGVDPKNILAVTFTNKAAKEMKNRINDLIGSEENKIFISTFHSFCAKLLRKNANKLANINQNYSILDNQDQLELIKKIFKELNISSTEIEISAALKFISECKRKRLSVDDAYDKALKKIETKKAEIYDAYTIHQQKNNSLDFDDLISKTVEILDKNKDVRIKYSQRFKYIHVDEFQDVNKIQFELLKLLTTTHNNICVVGDPDQNIYSWRGAEIAFINDFDKIYKNTKTIYLTNNYRSTKAILNLANDVISKNYYRLNKKLFSNKEIGHLPVVYQGETEDDEASWITAQVQQLISYGVSPSDILILYRSSFISRAIEQSFMKNSIKFKILGGTHFFERKEIKKSLAYLRFSIQKDDMSFKKIISTPKRGIGIIKIEKIEEIARIKKTSMWNVINYHFDLIDFSVKQKITIKNFIKLFSASPSDKDKNFFVGLNDLLTKSGYINALSVDSKNLARFENVKELLKSIKEQCKLNNQLTAGKYLSDIALDWIYEDTSLNTIQIMTIHKAKGAEAKHIFIMGVSESIFPSWKSCATTKELEEERRIFYVAITRAIERVYISYAKSSGASRFINQINKDKFKIATWYFKELTIEEKVIHDIFGMGIILEANNNILKIKFGAQFGIKNILANHKSLKRVG